MEHRDQVKGSLGVVALVMARVAASPAAARVPPLYKNCTDLNKKYPHGVGRAKARDKISGTP
jgi:Excalibur calcium-binding domain